MSRSTNLASRLKEVLIDGQWIANTNYQQQIKSVDWQQATQKFESLNTIALLTFHINYYLAGILNVFDGGDLEIRDKFSFDIPPILGPEDWQQLIDTFCTNAEKFIGHVSTMDDDQLDAPFVDIKYGSYERNIEGVIEHSYYHLGQISLLIKLLK